MKILLDTDIGSDCDDAGALALLHQLCNQGKAEILAITHCASEITGAITIKAINTWYGRTEIPIGRFLNRVFLEDDRCRCFTRVIAEKYLEKHDPPVFMDAVGIMRQKLEEVRDITMIAIGPLNNIAALLKSEADEISLCSGIELVKRNVKELYVMGGNFQDPLDAEYNIRCDIESARYVAEYFPKPITYCGFEVGVKVKTGNYLKCTEPENPVNMAYDIFTNGTRESWDPITVYCAIVKDDLFTVMKDVDVKFDEQGRTIWKSHGKDQYITFNKSVEKVCDVIDRLIL